MRNKPSAFTPPDLKRFEVRQIPVKPKEKLKSKLLEWMQEVVSAIPHQPGGKGPKYLVGTASGLADLEAATEVTPTSMKLGGGSNGGGAATEVHAKFTLAGRPDGRSYVHRVWFSLNPEQQKKLAASRQAELKRELLEEAELKNRNSPKARAFPAAQHLETWQEDIQKGAKIVQAAIDRAYEMAKEMAAMPDNPIQPKDIVMSAGGAATKGLGKAAETTWKVGEKVVEVIDKANEYHDMMQPDKKLERGISPFLQGHKTTGDKVVEKAVDVASNIPGFGPFVKLFAGMAFMVGAANFARELAQVRGRAYSWFIAGYVEGLSGVAVTLPAKIERDLRFFTKGMNFSKRAYNDNARFQAQAFLLWYALTHWVVGQNDAGEKRSNPNGDDFPEDYLAHWSPYTLAASLATLMKRKPYLTD